MNRLAASVQFWATVKIIKTLPASDFSPPPKVSSAIIVLKTTGPRDIDTQSYYAAVRALFSQPRKTLSNNLIKATGDEGSVVIKKLSAIGIVPNHRPQDLMIDDILTIARAFF
jgi:16S rRNA (adenine1518-N6/adenine1519-N6)-dimethyltransferase